MYRHISNLKRKFPNDVEFVPNTYLLASDWERFKLKKQDAKNNELWILK